MRRNLLIALLYTVATTVIFGVIYPLAVTGVAQLLFRNKADGQLLTRNGEVVGSRLIGQAFSSPIYFHSRPSAAGQWIRRCQLRWLEPWSHEPEAARQDQGRCCVCFGGPPGHGCSGRPGHGLRFGPGSATSRPRRQSIRRPAWRRRGT